MLVSSAVRHGFGNRAPTKISRLHPRQRHGAARVALLLAAALIAGCGGPPPTITFADVESPAAAGSLAPHLAATPTGVAVMSWLEPATDEAYAVRLSTLGADGWSAPGVVAQGSDWFVNWADVPSVVPMTADTWAAHWLVKRPGGTYAYDIALAISTDRGADWAAPILPHRDGTKTEHGFLSLFPWDDTIGAIWLDGRNMSPDGGGAPPGVDSDGGMSLRYARLAVDGAILDEGEIDGLVCECCQPDVAMTAAGPVLTYRDRSPAEVRDIAVTRYVDKGWTEPATVSDDHWKIAGCPVNGPAIDAQDDVVVVAWYGAPDRQRRVKLAWSRDSGATFSAPVVVAEDGTRGRVDVVLIADTLAAVSWVTRTGDDAAQLQVRQVSVQGDMSPVQVIADSQYSRSSGFPQMINAGDRLVFAWPEAGGTSRVLTRVANLTGG
jgi:hypothetical protein